MSTDPVKMITKIVMPVINPIKKKILKPFKNLKKLPQTIVKKSQAWLKAMVNPKDVSKKDYVLIGRRYYAKRLFVFILLAILILIYILFINSPAFIDRWLHRPVVFHQDKGIDPAYAGNAKVYGDEDALVYTGGVADGAFSGQGKLYDDQGKLSYVGMFSNGLKDGSGELYNPQGQIIYKGLFSADKYAGPGTLFFDDQSPQYVGEFQNGLYANHGTEYYPNGQIKYDGNFIAGHYSGQGKLFYEDGTVHYEGEFIADQFEGAGKEYDAKGRLIYEGGFKSGLYSGEGTAYYDNDFVRYKGSFLAGQYNGEGTLFDEAGLTVYTGAFAESQFNGWGKSLDPTGSTVYEGKFANNVYEGLGTLYDSEGTATFKGFFAKGRIDYPAFIGLSGKKITEILGDPSEITAYPPPSAAADIQGGDTAASDADAAGQNPASGTDTAAGAVIGSPLPPSGLFMVYANFQMSFVVIPSADDPNETTVSVVHLTNRSSILQLIQDIETADNPTSAKAGYTTTGVSLEDGSTVTIYKVGNVLYKIYYNRDSGKDAPEHAEISIMASPD